MHCLKLLTQVIDRIGLWEIIQLLAWNGWVTYAYLLGRTLARELLNDGQLRHQKKTRSLHLISKRHS